MAYAERTFLPLRRRALRILRPFAVLMRLRNPWSFLRLRLFGLNVGFAIIKTPPLTTFLLIIVSANCNVKIETIPYELVQRCEINLVKILDFLWIISKIKKHNRHTIQ